jgi:hypothetical protein
MCKATNTTELSQPRAMKKNDASSVNSIFGISSSQPLRFTSTDRHLGSEGWPVLKLPNCSEIVFGCTEHKLDIFDFQGDEFAFTFAEEVCPLLAAPPHSPELSGMRAAV